MATATELNAATANTRANAAKTAQVAQPGNVATTPTTKAPRPRGGAKAQAVGLPTLVQQAATLAAAPAAAPAAEKPARVRRGGAVTVVLTSKGNMYNPNEKAKVRGRKNVETWATIKGALAAGPATVADLQALVPTHADFIGYALRSGWIAVA